MSNTIFKTKIAGLTRNLPICKITDNLYIAAFIMLGDTELTKACAKTLLAKCPDFNIIITPESKSITLASEMANLHNDKFFIVARKQKKLYMSNTISHQSNSITTANPQTLFLDENDSAKLKGKKVLIVDDVISTGETLKALENLVTQCQGTVIAKAAVLAEGNAKNRKDIIFLNSLPLFSDQNGTVIN